jgi:hypothetical protein
MNPDVRIPVPEWSSSFLERNRFYLDIGLHLILFGVAVSPFVVLYLKRKSPVGWIDLIMLCVALFAVPWLTPIIISVLPLYLHPFVRGYAGLCAVVLIISIVTVAWRFKTMTWGAYAVRVLSTLVVLGLLIALCLPAVPSAREAAKRMQCANQIRNLAIGLLNTRDGSIDLSRYPPNNSPEVPGGPDISWRIKVLPYIERNDLRSEYQADQPWDSEANWGLACRRVDAYLCPSEPNMTSPKGGRFTSYAMLDNSNRDASNPKRLPANFSRTKDSYRILLIESCSANLIWTEPRDVDLDSLAWNARPRNSKARRDPWRWGSVGSSYHGQGTHVVFGDGRYRYIASTIDEQVMKSMILGEPWADDED